MSISQMRPAPGANGAAGKPRPSPNGRAEGEVKVSIHLLSPLSSTEAQLEPPSVALPGWHERDGTPHAVGDLTAGQSPSIVEEIHRLHADGIRTLAIAACAAAQRGDDREARRLASAASRLCGEIVGLWPVSGRSTAR
jgi:hypothetical protein